MVDSEFNSEPPASGGENIPPALAATPVGRAKKKAVVSSVQPTPAAEIEQPDIDQPIHAAEEAVTAAKDTSMDTFNTTTAAATDKAQAVLGDAQARTEDMMARSQKMFDEMNGFAKGNVEALVESSKIAARGFESLGQEAVAYAKRSFESATGAMKTFATVKSPTELMKLQSDYARTAFDQMVAETSRGTEAMLKLAGEVAQPISNRFAVAAEKAKIAA